jgi:hypothetical protein
MVQLCGGNTQKARKENKKRRQPPRGHEGCRAGMAESKNKNTEPSAQGRTKKG